MKILGLSFAPLHVPFRRRLQTLSVFFTITLLMIFGFFGAIFWLYVLFTPYYFLSLMYATWMYYDWDKPRQGSRLIKSIRYWRLWRYYASYFPAKLVKTEELDTNKNYIVGFHPHGIVAVGCFSNFGSEGTGFSHLFPGIKPTCLTLDGNFKIPFYRELLMLMGIASVTRESIEWILNKQGTGNAAVIVVGGAAEALDARPGEATLTLKNRKGFVRVAIMNGASLVPVYSFGENDVYDQVNNPPGSMLRMIQRFLSKHFGVSPPIFHGRGMFNYTLGFLPYRRPINSVVGKPIDVVRNPNPSRAEVDRVHSEYLQQLKELFDQYKGKYGRPADELLFV